MRFYYYSLGLALYFILPIAAQKPMVETPHSPEVKVDNQEFETLLNEIKDLKSKVIDIEEEAKATKDQLKTIRESLAFLTNSLSSAIDLTNSLAGPSQLTTNSEAFKNQADLLSHHLSQKFYNLQHDISILQAQLHASMSMTHPPLAQK